MAAAVEAEPLRVALFHTDLKRDGPGLLLRDILKGEDRQIEAVAAVVRAAEPDVIVVAGVDYDLGGHAVSALAEVIGGYPHRISVAPNRGVDARGDRNGDGYVGDPDDAQGYGEFRGQSGIAVLSRFALGAATDHTGFLWADLEGNIAPEGLAPDQRLATTSHLVVPVHTPDTPFDLALWHATPPVFDGPEDRNGRRNHDEAAFWLRWLDTAPEHVVLAGVANLDPVDGDGRPGALNALLQHPKLWDPVPVSLGGVADAAAQGGINATHSGDPARDTADWRDDAGRPGNLRVDYVLPSTAFAVMASGVFWPEAASLRRDVLDASRHRLVWVDLCAKRDTECLNGIGRPKPGQQLR